jgi:antitoxin ParD1/3/4
MHATILLTFGRILSKMSVAKLSVSLPDSLAGFVENYRKKRGLNRSQVFEEAVKLLRSRELEAAYQEANAETDKEWENTIGDGLADEAW